MSADAANDLIDRLRADLKSAMRARDADEVRTLRMLIAAIDNAQAVAAPVTDSGAPPRMFGTQGNEVTRRALSSVDLDALLDLEAGSRREDARVLEAAGQTEAAADVRTEAGIIDRYCRG